MEVADEPVNSRTCRKDLCRTHPIHGNGMLASSFFQRLESVRTGIAAHQMTLLIENFEFDRPSCSVCQVVIDDGAVGRIFSGWKFRRQRCVRIAIPAETNRFLR